MTRLVIGFSWPDSSPSCSRPDARNEECRLGGRDRGGLTYTGPADVRPGSRTVTRNVMARQSGPIASRRSRERPALPAWQLILTMTVTELTAGHVRCRRVPLHVHAYRHAADQLAPSAAADVTVPPLLVLCQSNCITGTDTCHGQRLPDASANAMVSPAINNSGVSLDLNDAALSMSSIRMARRLPRPRFDGQRRPWRRSRAAGSDTAPPWKAGICMPPGTIIFPAGSGNTHLYKTTAGGISGATEPLGPTTAPRWRMDRSRVDRPRASRPTGFRPCPIVTPNTTAATCYTDNRVDSVAQLPGRDEHPGIRPLQRAGVPDSGRVDHLREP